MTQSASGKKMVSTPMAQMTSELGPALAATAIHRRLSVAIT